MQQVLRKPHDAKHGHRGRQLHGRQRARAVGERRSAQPATGQARHHHVSLRGVALCIMVHGRASPSGCGWLTLPGVSQVDEEGIQAFVCMILGTIVRSMSYHMSYEVPSGARYSTKKFLKTRNFAVATAQATGQATLTSSNKFMVCSKCFVKPTHSINPSLRF